jgi:DNA repair protein RadA/Sms
MSGSPGSVGQVRECAAELLRAAKARGAVLFLLGHVTKDGTVAGPKVLEHLVDTVLQFDDEGHALLRVLRVSKNRFGPSGELGLFEMTERGLDGVEDAAAFFIEDRARNAPGRAVGVALEGSRPLLAEVQALVVTTRYPLPRRMATGLDLNRVLVLIAALEKHLHVRLESKDVFVSLAGGLRLRDAALDLAVCMAILSSARGRTLPADCAFLGEVSLLGSLGRTSAAPLRLKEAARAGFKTAVLPERSADDARKGLPAGIALRGAGDLAAAAKLCLGDDAQDDDATE